MTDDTCEALIEAAARSNTVTLLTLSGLELESVPESLDAPWTTRITRLFLSRNRISRLPPWFCARFEGLTGLYLHTNELVELPDDLARLSNLTELILARNQLSFLPHSLGQLTNLRQLTLSNNRIASLPESLSRLRSLELFNAGFNRLPVRIAGGEVLDKDVAQYLFYACNAPENLEARRRDLRLQQLQRLQREGWRPDEHTQFPSEIRAVVHTLMLLHLRHSESVIAYLPPELVFLIVDIYVHLSWPHVLAAIEHRHGSID